MKKTASAATQAPKAKQPGRYRKVEVRTWGDERFRALSPIPPCGQGLWLYLITGPRTGPIPGLFSAGPAAMAEDLGWPLDAFMHAMGEAIGHGMVRVDTAARVVLIPKAIQHNPPAAPNQVKTWGAEFDLIPECDLKREAYETLKASIHALGEGFAHAFDATWRKPSPKPSCMPSVMPRAIQEQEQEQDIDSEAKASAAGAAKPLSAKDKAWAIGIALLGEKGRGHIGKLVATYGEEVVAEAMEATVAEEPGDPKAWVVKACEAVAKRKPAKARTPEADLLDDPKPQWAIAAGFPNRYEANNDGCFEHNAAQFSQGKRVKVAA